MGDLDAMIVAYDVTNQKSFQSLKFWINEIKQDDGGIPVMLCGTKLDKASRRAIKEREVAQVARSAGLRFVETSAMDGTNVKRLFKELASMVD